MATHTILYIDDDPASRRLVQASLQHAGYRVMLASRALEGIDMARKYRPDLILTDINLPDMNGRELTTTLRADDRFRLTPIVAITASTSSEERDLAFAAGVNGYLTKPLDIDSLAVNIEFFLSGGTDSVDDTERLNAARNRYLTEVVRRLESRIRELEATNKSLRNLDNMKDTFIQLTAHELRTPLTLIAGYSRLLEDHPPLKTLLEADESIKMLINGLTDSINRMQSVIEEILTMSRIMTNQIELTIVPTNLGTIVRRVLSAYELPIRGRNLTVYFNQNEWPISMRADGDLLRIAIDNLISNAIKYTPDGGQIILSAQMDSKIVRFSIKDNGIGIAPEDQTRIFESFHTVSNIALHSTSKTNFGGGGLGLGLPICKGIVEAHGGKIWVESSGHDPNGRPGSEFIVVLPLHTQPKSRTMAKQAPLESIS